MKKLIIAAGLGIMFSALSVMPALADSPGHDNGYGDRGFDRREIRNDRRDIRQDRRDFRQDRRDFRWDRRDFRDDHHEYFRDQRPDYRCR